MKLFECIQILQFMLLKEVDYLVSIKLNLFVIYSIFQNYFK